MEFQQQLRAGRLELTGGRLVADKRKGSLRILQVLQNCRFGLVLESVD